MTRNYFFVSLDKNAPHGVTQFECRVIGANLEEMDGAAERASHQHLKGDPLFITSSGIPEIEIVHARADVQRVYVRNCDHPPLVTILDLDLSDDPEKFWKERERQLQERGFRQIPATVYVVEDGDEEED
jgi:hypothetical protein